MLRIIAHLDMDAFFASIEERDNPRFKGRPIVVGSDPEGGKGRGVVSTANYAARKYGIHSAQPISKAWRLAEEAKKRGEPGTVFLGVGMGKYSAESRKIMSIIASRAEAMEAASIDEAYMDLSFVGSFEKAEIVCREIKREIKEKEKLTCSVGLGPNKLIAKIASDMKKPDGLTVVRPEKAEEFLAPLGIRKIPGIGPKTEIILKKMGIQTVGDIKNISKEKLENVLGRWGTSLYKKARGLDDSPVGVFEEAKSIGEQETFRDDTRDPNLLLSRLKIMAEGVMKSFAKSSFKEYKTIGITVRFSDFTTVTRIHTLKAGASSLSVLEFEGLKLFLPFLDTRENPKRKAFRLLGIHISKFE